MNENNVTPEIDETYDADEQNETEEDTNSMLERFNEQIENLQDMENDFLRELEKSKILDFDFGLNYESEDNPSSDDECEDNLDDVDIPSWMDSLSDEDYFEIEFMTHDLIGEYMQYEVIYMSNPQFHENMKGDITDVLFQQLLESGLCKNENLEELESLVSEFCDNFFETHQNVPPRSYKNTFVTNDPVNSKFIQTMKTKIEGLQSIEQPPQRTPEWYAFRHNLITASNIWKALGSESQQNALIYEKCKPFEYLTNENTSVNVNSPLHWGNKYERISIAIYEKLYDTHVSDFGCIQHPVYRFIGASPDGINTLETSPRYGRMVEVKNIFNREITGIPKEEYWIQMQFQMETCDLDECDFLETRFKEYESEEEFYSGELLHEHRGIILYFLKKITSGLDNVTNTPHYVYMPLDIELTKESINEWIKSTRASLKTEYSLYETQYWYLDEISVVFVKRNREWFNSCIPRIEKIWRTIEEERVTGYEHRAVKKKPLVTHSTEETSQYIKHMPSTKNVCLVKLDENGEII